MSRDCTQLVISIAILLASTQLLLVDGLNMAMTSNDSSESLKPIYDTTWRYSVRNVFPDVPPEFENATIIFRDFKTDADGFVYVLCDVSSSYEYYKAEGKYFAYQLLLKYDAQLRLIWTQITDNQTGPSMMAIHNGFIYTAKYGTHVSNGASNIALVVSKWSLRGERIWQSVLSQILVRQPPAIAIAPDDSVYVWLTYFNLRCPLPYNSIFLKFDSSGALLWKKTSTIHSHASRGEFVIRNDSMYTHTEIVEKRDLSCEPLWNISFHSNVMEVDDTGNIYLAKTRSKNQTEKAELVISKWDSHGTQVWNSSFSQEFENGTYWSFECRDMAIGRNRSTVVMLKGLHSDNNYHLVKFNCEGHFLWDKIIEDETWSTDWHPRPTIQSSSTGLAYIPFSSSQREKLAIYAFEVGPYDIPSESSTLLVIVTGTGLGIIIIAVAIYLRKYIVTEQIQMNPFD
jgi:hypothetical protein